MRDKKKSIVFLHVGGHYVHREFAKTITSEFIDINLEPIPKNRDIYFLEAGYPKIILKRMLRLIKKDSKIISLFADPKLYFMKLGNFLDQNSQEVKKYSWFKRVFFKFLLGRVDGGICVSHFEQNLLKEFSPKIPSRVVYPFISDERITSLSEISPKLNSQKILFIGNNDYYYKGVDVLLEAFKILKKKRPNIELFILGNLSKKKEWKTKGVFFEGRRDIIPYLKRCSLCVHPSRGEAFGVSIIESLLSGVPAIVSNETGAGEILREIDENLLFSLNSEKISQKIDSYFNSSQKYKKKLSQKGRKEAKKFPKKRQIAKFKKSFQGLLKEIGS